MSVWVGKIVHFKWPGGTVCHAAVVIQMMPPPSPPDEALLMLFSSRDTHASLPANGVDGAGWHYCDGGVCTAKVAS